MSASNKEKEAVLNLSKYFGEHWVIFDVGSNKGTWSDILMDYRDSSYDAHKYNVHLFEPNDLLLNYTRVKYDYNKNVIFNSFAVSDSATKADFYYFTNENSGLSSLLNNPKWDYLPKQWKTIHTYTLDRYCTRENISQIDIIKIDIEGAELRALRGCKQLLQNRSVKVFQVEYSEHYALDGITFKDVFDFMQSYGYFCWDWDGTYFNKIDSVSEECKLDNFYFTYMEIGRYHYTQYWNRAFIENTKGLEKFSFALEIGCFEGLTSNYICDNLLLPDGRMIAVDPLQDYYLKEGSDEETNKIFIGQYERFIRNTKGQPIELQRKTSTEAFPYLEQYRFDFIYVDGSHLPKDVYSDGVNSFRLLKTGGHILFDDYTWGDCGNGIDRFIEQYIESIEIICKNEQVLIRKEK